MSRRSSCTTIVPAAGVVTHCSTSRSRPHCCLHQASPSLPSVTMCGMLCGAPILCVALAMPCACVSMMKLIRCASFAVVIRANIETCVTVRSFSTACQTHVTFDGRVEGVLGCSQGS